MRGATDSREMILNGNETAPLFENFCKANVTAPHHRLSAEPPPKGKPRKDGELKQSAIGSHSLAALPKGESKGRRSEAFKREKVRRKCGHKKNAKKNYKNTKNCTNAQPFILIFCTSTSL